MDMNEAVAKAIGAERNIAGVTVRELSELAQIPTSSLMRVLQAQREIKVNQVAAIAAALNLYPHEIVEHAETILSRANRTAPTLTLADAPVSGEGYTLAASDRDYDAEVEAMQEDP